jgi:hypothetical protein
MGQERIHSMPILYFGAEMQAILSSRSHPHAHMHLQKSSIWGLLNHKQTL